MRLYVTNNGSGAIRKYSPLGEDLGDFVRGLPYPVDMVIRPAPIPEPATFGLLLIGALGPIAHRWRRWNCL